MHNHGHGPATEHGAGMEADFRRRFWISTALTVPVLLLSPMVQEWVGLSWTFSGQLFVLWGLASLVVLWGGWPFFRGAAQALPRGRLDMNVLVAVALLAGYAFSTAATFWVTAPEFYWEISTLTVFLLFGHWMEMRSLRGASGALRELISLIPPSAERLVPGGTETVPTAALQLGDILLVKPGARVPIDGVVVDGRSEVNEALVTGESAPVPKSGGDTVVGGAVNGAGAFRMRVTAVGEETALGQIIALITAAQASKTPTQRLADRAAQYLTITALLVGGLALVFWLAAGAGPLFSVLRLVTVLIVACPHALGLAIPTVVMIASALGARAGILIRNNEAMETAIRVETVIFDKTGTLTEGVFGVTDVVPLGEASEVDLLRLAAAVEAASEHSLARDILREARARDISLAPATDFLALPGQGAQARVQGVLVQVGNRALLEAGGITLGETEARVETLTGEGKSVAYVVREGRLLGLIALADLIRPESREAVHTLRAMGVTVAMLTGDHHNVAAFVARELGIEDYFAEVPPERKAQAVRRLQERGHAVAMVGDGINDAPALAQADLGVAIGAGTQVAIESADVVLVHNDPRDIVRLLRLSRATTRKMVENLAWATGYNVFAIPLAAGVLSGYGIVLAPEWAALLMAGSSIVVVLNAQLLRRARLGETTPAEHEAAHRAHRRAA